MNNKEDDNWWNENLILKLIFGGFILAFAWFTSLRFIFSKKVSKGVLAKEYGVENKILMKWLKLFGSEQGISMYHGTQIRKVKRTYFTAFLGEPDSGPKYKDKSIVKKEEIWIAIDSNETTVREKIIALEHPEEVIGMSYETYKKLSYLPPKYMTKIITFLENGNPAKEDFQDLFTKIDRSLPYSTF